MIIERSLKLFLQSLLSLDYIPLGMYNQIYVF